MLRIYEMMLASIFTKNGIGYIAYVLSVICVTAGITSGQSGYKIEQYSTEQGLSHRRVNGMLRDKEGFMWFATWDGINRFDGHSFLTFKSAPKDKYQLGNSRISRMLEDENGHLWIQANDYQLYRFDKNTQQFLPLSDSLNKVAKRSVEINNILLAANGWVWLQSKTDGIFCVPQNDIRAERIVQYATQSAPDFRLLSDSIRFFRAGKDGRIWIGTYNGLVCLETSASGVFKKSRLVPPVQSGVALTAYEEDTDQVYFGLANGALTIFNKKTKQFSGRQISAGSIHALLRSVKTSTLYASTSLGEIAALNTTGLQLSVARYQHKENLSSLYEDKTGVLWVEPEKAGVIRYDPLEKQFQLLGSGLNAGSAGDINNRYFWVQEDYKGNVWVSMKGGALGYCKPATHVMETRLPMPDDSYLRLPSNITAHYYDRSGVLWLTTSEGGLDKIVIQNNAFKHNSLTQQNVAGSEAEVRLINYDRQGRLWLGLKTGKLQVYQQNEPVKQLFQNEPAGGIMGVYAMLQDSRGNIWLGTKDNGLYKAIPLDKEQTRYSLTHFKSHKNIADSLPCNKIYALLEDAGNRIWMGSLDNGLVLIEDNAGGIKFLQHGNAFKNYPKEGFRNIRSMCLDEHGNIWMGTTTGLLVFDAGNRNTDIYRYKSYKTIPGDSESLGNNDILHVYKDSKSRIWLCTSGGGYCKAITDNPLGAVRFRNYTIKDGLPNDYIFSCTQDKQGNLWLATENGLSRFNPETQVFRNFDSYDGLSPSVAFSEGAVAYVPETDQLYFGTQAGYITCNPRSVSAGRINSTMAFTALYINNEQVNPGDNVQLIPSDINSITHLNLKYNQNIISIHYAVLDYRGSGDQQGFAYRLKGFDSTWHNELQYRNATYTNLPPGHYIFEVKSLSTDLYNRQPYKSLAITILPPPWKTVWAYLLYVLVIGVILFFIHRYAMAMIRLRQSIAVEQRMAALKMDFFTNVSHELRTPLTLIVNPLERVAAKEKLPADIASYIDVARKNASRMVRFINQLLDLRKVQSGKASLRVARVEMVSFVKIIADHFREAAGSKQITLEVLSSEKEVIAWVDAEKMDVVVYNLLSNAVKFTPPGKFIQVFIRSASGEEGVSVAVHDQGTGVPPEKLETIFELFHGGESVAATEPRGSGIGLALSRDLVLLHGGVIKAENNAGGGLTVTVKLKPGNAHFRPEDLSDHEINPLSMAVETPVEQQVLSRVAPNISAQSLEMPLVLLVEDNQELRNFIREQLSLYYRVETAMDGNDGWQKAGQLLPDLIVSDIMMPGMDGIQMLDKLKNDSLTSHIPVVLLSARYSVESQMEGLRYGADYYITKPFDSAFLIAAVDNLLLQRKRLFDAMVEKKKAVALSPEPVVITSRDEAFLKEVIKLVEAEMNNPEFNMDTVAETMALSRTNFYRKFKSLTTLTPMEFVRDMRLQRAKQYFDNGGHNVSEVAFLTGFNSPKYFSTCFREKYHLSPSDYLKARSVSHN